MYQGGTIPRVLAGLSLCLALVAPLVAQQMLYVLESDGYYYPVVKASQDRPFVMKQGKLEAARGTRFALRRVEEYLPVYIKVLSKEAGSTGLVPLTSGPSVPFQLNNEFYFNATFESASRLEDVFLVLALESSDMGRNIFTYEVGLLEAGTPKQISVFVPLEQKLGQGKLNLFLFSGGAEVFSSEQPATLREEMLDRMIAKRIAGVQQMGPRPFFGLGPDYPDALRQTGLRGEVMVTMRISPRGVVLDPVVERATHPAFGEAALAVLPLWRFVPRIEGGRAVESMVKLPFVFDPPEMADVPKH